MGPEPGATYLAGYLTVLKVFPLALAAPLGQVALVRAAVLAGTLCLITLPLVGIPSWADYVAGLQASRPLCGDPLWVNLSLACVLGPLTGLFIAKWAGLPIAALLAVLALRSRHAFAGVAFAAGAILAPATELHLHYSAILFVVMVIGFASAPLTRERAVGASP